MTSTPHAPPEAARRRRPRRVTLAFSAMLAAAVAWAFAWGAHDHGLPVTRADLSALTADRTLTIDASALSFDLSTIEARPGEVLDLHLVGSAGEPHAFVLTGAGAGGQMDTRTGPDGDTIVRLQVPESGAVDFFCAIPGHEGMHGMLVVNP